MIVFLLQLLVLCVFFANTDACAHNRWYLVPNYDEAHEARQIVSSICVPTIEVSVEANGSTPMKHKVVGTYSHMSHSKSFSITTVGSYTGQQFLHKNLYPSSFLSFYIYLYI